MRKKYCDCQRQDGDCTRCSLVHYGRDCHNNQITRLEWFRRRAGLTQARLAEAAGMNISQIQKIESGEVLPGNVTAKNLLALADVLGVEPKKLL